MKHKLNRDILRMMTHAKNGLLPPDERAHLVLRAYLAGLRDASNHLTEMAADLARESESID